MSGSNRNPKKLKGILSFFKKRKDESSIGVNDESLIGLPCESQGIEFQREDYDDGQGCDTGIEFQREDYDDGQGCDTTSLERDPGLRRQINEYSINERDDIRRAYMSLGPYQPKLEVYPSHQEGAQSRRFQYNWFSQFSWLEYSVAKDRAFCFPCFLFENEKNKIFSIDGFKSWKRIGGQQCVFFTHSGSLAHQRAMVDWRGLGNQSRHISTVMNAQSSREISQNRLRLNTTIESVRFLAGQGMAFRGNDESEDSFNRGNLIELVKYFARCNLEIEKVVLHNAPGNAKYTSPLIQKEILHIFANKVRNKIREEIGDSKFCILVDEAVDESNKEQMAIILRFVDGGGFIRERFFDVVSVPDTTALTLKNEIDKVLVQFNLQVENLRGQGYDGASNMRGAWNGLQALFMQDCPYAYYVHCFAHRLQLALNASAKDVKNVWKFFSMLNQVVNFICASAKRQSELKLTRKFEVEELLKSGKLGTGRGANQSSSLQRPGNTRWGSHFNSIRSLIELFGSTQTLLLDIAENGPNHELRGEADTYLDAIYNFDFVFVMLLLNKVMGLTDYLCQAFQKKSLDIIRALNLVSDTISHLQNLRDDGWDELFGNVLSFCEQYDIEMPDMSAPYKIGRGRSCQQRDSITVEHHYRVDIFNAVIDFQMIELRTRFPEQTVELLSLSSALDPNHSFRSFQIDDICLLAEKFYPADFTPSELYALRVQCTFYKTEMDRRPDFQDIDSVSSLYCRLVETGLAYDYHLLSRLICLVLTLPVSTSTTERAFSSMKFIKNRLRNKIEDEFLADAMTIYIERELANSIDNESIISEFYSIKKRRGQLI